MLKIDNKITCLNDGFVQLIDHMGSDHSICNAARVSYGNHKQETKHFNQYSKEDQERALEFTHPLVLLKNITNPGSLDNLSISKAEEIANDCVEYLQRKEKEADVNLIRYLMRHRHSTPFEMVSFVFLVRCPIHVARQWMRHRTWSYNEYSTRYKPAIDSFETTEPDAWRLQATDNKQGSKGILTADNSNNGFDGEILSDLEIQFHQEAKILYQDRLNSGVAREQARKDLPLSTYTEFYAKVDLHNLFHFLSLRLDSHAQLEIRQYATAIASIIKQIIPISYQAFEDYRLNGTHFSEQEIKIIKEKLIGVGLLSEHHNYNLSKREWSEFLSKLE